MKTQARTQWLLTAVLLLSFWLMVGSAVQKSPTVDEQSKLFRGTAYLTENATHFLLGHPLGGSSIAATGTLLESNLQVGIDQPFWESGNWSLAGNAFLWQLNENPTRLIFLGRLPIIFMALMLGVLLFHWGKQVGGNGVGLVAAGMLLLDPNYIAHGRLITGDLLLTTFFVLTIYGFWRASLRKINRNIWLIVAGIGLGLASLTKFNAALLLPILAGLTLNLTIRRRQWGWFLNLAWVVGVAGLLIVAFYRFDLRPLPGGAFWEDFFWVLEYFSDEHGAYLFGEVSPTGWWYYFPVAFILKTPLPTLILLGWAVVNIVRNKQKASAKELDFFWFLLVPIFFYFGSAMSSSLNIGYRHLLPMLPFLYLGTAVYSFRPDGFLNSLIEKPLGKTNFLSEKLAGKSVRSDAIKLLLFLWLIILPIWVFPHYIPFFNLLAGGSQNGWRTLSDSNVDWGQDLPALAQWQTENELPTFFLSYFGTARPSAYGIQYQHIPTWGPTPEQGNPARQAYNPHNPAPGLYAISVNHLHGVVLGDAADFYAPFRQLEPVEKIGNSIFIYEVAPNGEPMDVVYSGLRPSTLNPSLHFQTNDVRIRWIDHNAAFLWPNDGGWLAVPHENQNPALAEFWPQTAVSRANNQALYELPPPPILDWIDSPVQMGEQVSFLGASNMGKTEGEVELLTAWRSERPLTTPHQIFVHALNASGENIGQWDGVDSDVLSWMSGDVFIQYHRFSVSNVDDVTQFTVGFYNPETGVRLGETTIVHGVD